MDKVILERIDKGDQGVFGHWYLPGFHCFSGELPERDNRVGESCILPPGMFSVKWGYSPHFRRFTYRVESTPGRAGILIHSANLMGDRSMGFRAQLLGCIALGERLGWLDKQKALLLSAPAVRRFEQFLQYKPFTLEVLDA